jgi:hypothetical protein
VLPLEPSTGLLAQAGRGAEARDDLEPARRVRDSEHSGKWPADSVATPRRAERALRAATRRRAFHGSHNRAGNP